MRHIFSVLVGGLCAILLILQTGGNAVPVQASQIELRIIPMHGVDPQLSPGVRFTVVAHGLGALLRTYCLGLASMRDRYAIPVSLGSFQAGDDGLMVVQARVPTQVFPAEPPGPFLLFIGRCTSVAPDGIYAATVVTIHPAGR